MNVDQRHLAADPQTKPTNEPRVRLRAAIVYTHHLPLLRMRFSGTSVLGKQGQICFSEYLKIVNMVFA